MLIFKSNHEHIIQRSSGFYNGSIFDSISIFFYPKWISFNLAALVIIKNIFFKGHLCTHTHLPYMQMVFSRRKKSIIFSFTSLLLLRLTVIQATSSTNNSGSSLLLTEIFQLFYGSACLEYFLQKKNKIYSFI